MPSNHGSGSAWDREMQKYHNFLDEKEADNRRKRRSGGQHESPRPQYGDPPHRKGTSPPREEEHFYDPRDYEVPEVEPRNLPPGASRGPGYGNPYELPQHQYSHPQGGQPSGEEEHFYDPRDYEVPEVEPWNLPRGGGPRYGSPYRSPQHQYSHPQGGQPDGVEKRFLAPCDIPMPSKENLPPGGRPGYGYPFGSPQHQYSHPHGGQPSGGEKRPLDPCDIPVSSIERDSPPGGGPRYEGQDELPRRQVGEYPQWEGTWSQSVHHHPGMPERRPTNVAPGHYRTPLPPVKYKVNWGGPPDPRKSPPRK